jgi:hypothetical protein
MNAVPAAPALLFLPYGDGGVIDGRIALLDICLKGYLF